MTCDEAVMKLWLIRMGMIDDGRHILSIVKFTLFAGLLVKYSLDLDEKLV